VADKSNDFVALNIPPRLEHLRNSLKSFIKVLSRQKRQAASHMFVFMISCDKRDKKPYALPVQCVPCRSLTIDKLRELLNRLITEMNTRGMKIAGIHVHVHIQYMYRYVLKFSISCISSIDLTGDTNELFSLIGFCSDGEFNSLRNRGYTRPLSVFAIRSDVRSKYARMREGTMKAMLSPIGRYNDFYQEYIIILYTCCTSFLL